MERTASCSGVARIFPVMSVGPLGALPFRGGGGGAQVFLCPFCFTASMIWGTENLWGARDPAPVTTPLAP